MSAEIFHVPLVALVFRGHMFDVDHATVLCTDPTLAERLAELQALRWIRREPEPQAVRTDG